MLSPLRVFIGRGDNDLHVIKVNFRCRSLNFICVCSELHMINNM